MKKIVLAAAIVGVTAGVALADFTAHTATTPRAGVVNSMHDMRGYMGTTDVTVGGIDQKRVCAFCHTPHHSLQDAGGAPGPIEYLPLWSHEINYGTFTPYQSTTLQSTAYGPDILVGPSRLCMSCHDGTVAVDTHYGNGISGAKLNNDAFNQAGVGAGVTGAGHDLANDHPIGFDYNAVSGATVQDTPAAMTATKDGYINPSTVAFKNRPAGAPVVTIADRLYAPQGTTGVGVMTCASCHDVHNRKNGDDAALGINYLVMAPQEGSAMCVSCHIK